MQKQKGKGKRTHIIIINYRLFSDLLSCYIWSVELE